MSLKDLMDSVTDHALASGVFESVNKHEPKTSPTGRLTAALWSQEIGPIKGSGLDSTSVRILFRLRIYSNMLQEPQDAIDPEIIDAVDVLMAAYTGDFTLGGTVRNVDLLGTYGVPLSAKAGYINVSNVMYRVMDITLPLIVNDVWSQDE